MGNFLTKCMLTSALLHLESFYFLGLNFGAFYFFGLNLESFYFFG